MTHPTHPARHPVDPTSHKFHSTAFQHVVKDAVKFFLQTPVHPLPAQERFLGAGVYALYYLGQSGLYGPLGLKNSTAVELPIYVGKTNPTGWRKGRAALADDEKPKLHHRLHEHYRNIQAADDEENLNPADFRCRFMILAGPEASLIGAVEATLISRYQPIWNRHIDGFGNHDPGSGRYNQAPSDWDILHPGRSWAARLQGQMREQTEVAREVREILASLKANEEEDEAS